MKNTTAIIITFLRPEYTKECIKSLKKYKGVKILVAENGKFNADLKNFVNKRGGKYILMPFDSGVCYARNRLVELADTEFILVGDDDFYYTKDAKVDKMVKFLQKHKEFDLIGGRIYEDKLLDYQGHINKYENNEGNYFIYEKLDFEKNIKEKPLEYQACDITFNFFVARRESIVPWDQNIKVAYEHSIKGDEPVIIRNIRKDKDFIEVRSIDSLIPKSLSKPTNSYSYIPHSNLYCWTEVGWRKIKRVIMHKCKERICEITTRNSFVECTEHHSLVINGESKTPNDLKVGSRIENIKFPDLMNEIKVDSDWAWFMGFFMAEGCCSIGKRGDYKISITNQNLNDLNKCIRILNKFGIFAKILKTQDRKDKCYFLHIEDNIKYKDIFLDFYDGNRNKVVPNGVFRWDKKSRQSFFEGFLAGDGSKSAKALFIQKSKIATQGILIITRDLYKYYSLYRQSNKYGKWFSVQLSNENNRERKNPKDTIEKMTYYDYTDYVYDIEIDDDKHTFTGGVGNVNLHNSDWFLSMKNAGRKVAFTPEAIVIHKPKKVKLTRETKNEYRKYRNRKEDMDYFFRKHKINFSIGFLGTRFLYKDVKVMQDKFYAKKRLHHEGKEYNQGDIIHTKNPTGDMEPCTA